MSGHFPGHLSVFDGYDDEYPQYTLEGGGTTIALMRGSTIDPNPSATARRLAACWNACQGLSTEALERLGTLDRARVSQEVTRDHMAAALQQALPIIDAYRRLSGGDGDLVAANIRALLR